MSPRRKTTTRRAAPAEPSAECICMGVLPEVTRMLREFGSPDARGHFRAARVEVLKGVRALIEHRIDTLSRRPGRGTTIEVD